MKERLLNQPTPTDSLDMERLDGGTPVKEPNLQNDYPAQMNPGVIPEPPEMPPDSLIGTVVKVNDQTRGNHRENLRYILWRQLIDMILSDELETNDVRRPWPSVYLRSISLSRSRNRDGTRQLKQTKEHTISRAVLFEIAGSFESASRTFSAGSANCFLTRNLTEESAR